MKNNCQKNNKAFTLIELLIVIAIAVIISAALVPLFSVTKQDAKFAKALSEMEAIRKACLTLFMDIGTWPPYIEVDHLGYELVANSDGLVDWQGPYLPTWPVQDPWGRDYILEYSSLHVEGGWGPGPERFVVYSLGKDGVLDSGDPYVIVCLRTF